MSTAEPVDTGDWSEIASAYWAEQGAAPFWTVPVAHGGEMPWLKLHERGLLVAINRAHLLGRTVLLIDNSDDSIVDTYYDYNAALIVEAKKMVLDVARGSATVDEVLEQCRVQLVDGMRFGKTLYIRMTNSAADFASTFNAADKFPLSLFDRTIVGSLEDYKEGTANNLWGSDHPLAACLREEDLSQGIFQPRFSHKSNVDGVTQGFEVVLCTQFPTDEFHSFLADALPMPNLQPIKLLPSSVRLKYVSYDRVFQLEPGGTLRFETLDEEFCLSFVFKGRPSVRLYLEAKAAMPVATLAGGGGRGGGWHGGGRGRPPPKPAAPTTTGEPIERDRANKYGGLKGGAVYHVVVEEDEAAEAAARAEGGGSNAPPAKLSAAALKDLSAAVQKPKGAAGLPGRSDDGSTRTAQLLASDLKALGTADLDDGERSARFRALREAADLQDVVFGGR